MTEAPTPWVVERAKRTALALVVVPTVTLSILLENVFGVESESGFLMIDWINNTVVNSCNGVLFLLSGFGILQPVGDLVGKVLHLLFSW